MTRKSRSRRRRGSCDDAKSQLMVLPNDTLLDILLRLPAKSVACIKCVSKTLLAMVNNISFSTIHTRRLLIAPNSNSADQVPRLVSFSCYKASVTLQSLRYKDICNLTKGRYAITIPSADPYNLFPCFVFGNVFCLGSVNGNSVLINPLGERRVLRLPESSFARLEYTYDPYVYRTSRFGMGFDDDTNTYKILCLTHEEDASLTEKYLTAHVLVLGTNSWRQISSLPPCGRGSFMDMSTTLDVVCAYGAVHWLTGTNIVSFDFKTEEFSSTPIPPTLQSSLNEHSHSNPRYWNFSVFTLGGCLAILDTRIHRGSTIIDIWVLKDFGKTKQWERYYNKRVSNYFPVEYHGSPGEWEHGIFLTTYDFFEICVFFLDLRFGSVHRVIYQLDDMCAPNTFYLGMYSYSETLISLKDYGDLEDAHGLII